MKEYKCLIKLPREDGTSTASHQVIHADSFTEVEKDIISSHDGKVEILSITKMRDLPEKEDEE